MVDEKGAALLGKNCFDLKGGTVRGTQGRDFSIRKYLDSASAVLGVDSAGIRDKIFTIFLFGNCQAGGFIFFLNIEIHSH